MKVSVFGLGYVGAVSCACLPELGHEVIGVDINPAKVEMINAGQSPVIEEHISELIGEAVDRGKLRAVSSAAEAVEETDVSLISVATPSNANYSPNLSAIDSVIQSIGLAIRGSQKRHTIIIRSTVPPGTTEGHILPILEPTAGRKVGDRLSLVFNPEFMREGSSVKDFRNPPQTVIGSIDSEGYAIAEQLYSGLPGAVVRTSCQIAESVKYLSNVFHAMKIVFANEVGSVLKACGLDGREAMRIFCQDTHLNISSAYLRPGFAFGGSCLPKEVKGFLNLAQERGVQIPTLRRLLESNTVHVDRAFDLIARDGRQKVALFGLAFKPGTDDLRESPLVALAERLIGKGFEVSIYDRLVKTSRLLGKNKEFIDREIPHLDRLLCDTPEQTMVGAGVVVVGHADSAARAAIVQAAAPTRIVDLAGYADLSGAYGSRYEGICW